MVFLFSKDSLFDSHLPKNNLNYRIDRYRNYPSSSHFARDTMFGSGRICMDPR